MSQKEYHFIREIREQPKVVADSVRHADNPLRDIAERYHDRIDRVVMVGCGDPFMLGLAAVYAFEQWARLPAESIEAAEFAGYRHELINERTLVILITSSGKTVKVIDAARLAAKRGAPAFALTNLVPSPITDEVTEVIQTQAGWSDSFPVKQTSTALAVLYALALHLAESRNTLATERITALRQALYEDVPAAIEAALRSEDSIRELANQYLGAPIYAFIGNGPNLATAQLAAAKMKETSQSRSEATNLEEYAHLHCLSLRDGDPVFVITYPGEIGARSKLICQHVLNNGGRLIVVGPQEEAARWGDLDITYLTVPDHPEMYGPLVAYVPLHLFAYYVAVGKNRNPDRPPDRGPLEFLQEVIYTSMLEGWFDR